MKKIISATIAAICAASALASCTTATLLTPNSSLLTSTASSSDLADASWLASRLGKIPDNVTVGTADSLGIDMDTYESDGYFIRTSSGETVIAGKTSDGLDRAVRRYAKAVKYGDPITDVTYHEGARIEKMTVAGRDIADFTVVYTHTVDPVFNERQRTYGNGEYAAKEFVRLVREATGITLPTLDLSTASVKAGTPVISFDAPEDGAEFGNTAWSYEVKGGDLYFRGSGLCGGCSSGVYVFFEREAGWKSLTYGDAYLEEADLVDFPEGLSHSGDKTFGGYQLWGIMNADYDFHFNNPTANYWGYHACACHGMQTNMFVENDYIQTQICYSDEEKYEECRDNVEKYIQSHIAAGEVPGETLVAIDVAQGDNNHWCDCKFCRQIFREEGSESGATVRFTNRLSEEMNEKYPGILYQLFAYEATLCPPKKTLPNELTHITFCMNGLCLNHAIHSGECYSRIKKTTGSYDNKIFDRYLTRWCEITDNVYVWYYTMDGGVAQYNTIPNLYEDIKYFKEIGVGGFFLEGEYYGHGVGRMNFEAIAALQWDGDLTYDGLWKVIDEKAERYYGESDIFRKTASFIRASHQGMGCVDCWRNEDIHANYADLNWMADHIDDLCKVIDRAIEDAPSRETESNCKRLSLMPIVESCFGGYRNAQADGDKAKMAHFAELYDTFYKRGVECNFDMERVPMGICFYRAFAPTIEEDFPNWVFYFD